MGLLMHQLSDTFHKVADAIYERHFVVDEKLKEEYDDNRRLRMYEDILHNLSFLQATLAVDDPAIFKNYAKWLAELMLALMPDLPETRIKEQLLTHYDITNEVLSEQLSPAEAKRVTTIIATAKTVTKTVKRDKPPEPLDKSKYAAARTGYFELIKAHQTQAAIRYIRQLYDLKTFRLEEIFIDVLQPVLYTIGDLWHRNQLSVDEEHYMSSITQVAMSQFYDVIFEHERNNLSILTCAVGSELHEIGIRMISDLFENIGWNSHYLGASLPEKYVLNAIKKHDPTLVALSVTMPQQLATCEQLVRKIRAAYPEKKVIVGGQAFKQTNKLYEKWPIDFYAEDARKLLRWTKKTFEVV